MSAAAALLAGCFLSHDNAPPPPSVDAGPPVPPVDARECNPEEEPPGDRGCEGGPTLRDVASTPPGPLGGWWFVGREDVDGAPVRACNCFWFCRDDSDCPARDGIRSRCVRNSPEADGEFFICKYPCERTSDCPSGMRCLVTDAENMPRECAWAVDAD